jgi:Ca2+-binding RTX toxin-like protein
VYIEGNERPNTLTGGEEADEIYGQGGRDTIRGMGGDDSLFGGEGDDSLLGGDGVDQIQDFEGDNYVDGGAGDDVVGIGGQSTVHGGLGDDSLRTQGSLSELFGDDGDDYLEIYGAANGALNGGAGADVIEARIDYWSGPGELNLDGGGGADRFLIHVESFDGGMQLDLRQTGPVVLQQVQVTLSGFEAGEFRISAEGQSKVNVGDANYGVTISGYHDDLLIGGRGDSRFGGGGGNDTIKASGGADTLDGGDGDDVLSGGKGSDTAIFETASSVEVDLCRTDVQFTGDGFDLLTGIENVRGGGGRDRLIGTDGANRLEDGPADMSDSADTLIGGGGADTLVAHCGSGADSLVGGDGADRFVFALESDFYSRAADVIADLTAEDVIDISAIDANWYVQGDQKFKLASEFNEDGGRARLVYDAKLDSTFLLLDVDGYGADYTIELRHGDWTGFDGLRL